MTDIDSPPATHTDISSDGWIDRRMPHWSRPYFKLARLDRPTGIWLLLLPCWWAIALASPTAATGIGMTVLFTIGAIVMRGAGCTVNDIIDRKIDAQVERTRGRPLPSGQIGLFGALVFLALLLLLGLGVLVQLNRLTIALGVASLVLVGAYPLMKRLTWWPQAFLGLTFNWGAIMGWTAVTGHIGWAPSCSMPPAFAGPWSTTRSMPIRTAATTKAAGVKSTARRFGDGSAGCGWSDLPSPCSPCSNWPAMSRDLGPVFQYMLIPGRRPSGLAGAAVENRRSARLPAPLPGQPLDRSAGGRRHRLGRIFH
jgi:4-hydroxybenzoate polyprenyltransferase